MPSNIKQADRTVRYWFITLGYLIGLLVTNINLNAQEAVPSVEDIQSDVRQFQQFFRSRFPDLSLQHYQDGVNALPQYAPRRLNWELLLEFPPYETEMLSASKQWQTPLANGFSLTECFAGKPPPTAYPYHFDGRVHTIVGDINQCLLENGAEPLDPMSAEMARLEAAFKAPWSGQLMDVDYRDEEMRRLYRKGQQYFWAKRGQMNLSCANCHVHNAGNQLRGDVLGAALGQGVGFPVYSSAWGLDGKAMGTLHRRYASCNTMAGAAPLSGQSELYIALEIYQAIVNTGVPIKVPGLRQ